MSEEPEWKHWDYDTPIGWIDGSILMKSTANIGDGEMWIDKQGISYRINYGVWVGIDGPTRKRIIIYELEPVEYEG